MALDPMSEKIARAQARKRRIRSDQFVVILAPDDRLALDESSRIERLSRADVIRRALRAYYRKLRQTEQIAS